MVNQSDPLGGGQPARSGPSGHDHAASCFVHGTVVRLSNKGILLIGPSTSGKSDLALRLIDVGAVLVADDQVRLAHEGSHLSAGPHERLAGLIEVRGIGILRVPFEDRTQLDLAVELEPDHRPVEPLPEPETATWLGVNLPKIRLDARAPSAVARIRAVLRCERVY